MMAQESQPNPSGSQVPKPVKAPEDHFRLASRVDAIESVLLVSGAIDFSKALVIDSSARDIEFVFERPRTRPTLAEQLDAVVVDCDFTARLRPKGAGDEGIVGKVEATLRVKYRLRLPKEEAAPYSQGELGAFGAINALLTTTPYWREFLTSSIARAGFRVVEIPVFNPFEEIENRKRAALQTKSTGTGSTSTPE